MVSHFIARCKNTRRGRLKSRPLLYCVIFVFLGVACSNTAPPNTSDNNTSNSNTLKLTVGASPQTLDPHAIVGLPAYKVLMALSEPLLNLDYQTFTIEPGVAERWQQSENGLVYQFFLREQAKWSNGEKVSAQDFVASFKRILSPKFGSPIASELFGIEQAEAFYRGEESEFKNVGVKALSEDILQISLAKPDPLFLKRIANITCAPIHMSSVTQYGDFEDPNNPWSVKDTFVSNGPFMLTQWQLNKKIVVKKNPHYWDAAAVLLDGMEFNLTESESIEERLYRAGEIHVAMGGRVPAEKIEYYRKHAPNELKSATLYATYFYNFNSERKPFDDVRVRKALAMAVNRQHIIDAILKNGEPPASTLTLAADGYVPPKTDIGYQPDLAKKLLADAGYPQGKGFPEFTLVYNTMESHRKIAVAIQHMWKTVLNIDARLENQEWKVFLSSKKSGAFDVARGGITSTLGDPADLLQYFSSDYPANYSRWRAADFDQLLRRSQLEQDPEKRYSLLRQAESLVMSEAPILPIFHYRSSYLVSEKVKGFKLTMADIPTYKGVYLEAIDGAE